jgi:hypothetical protein
VKEDCGWLDKEKGNWGTRKQNRSWGIQKKKLQMSKKFISQIYQQKPQK